jgi:hypothetical protein
VTVKSLSIAMGIREPGFQLLSLSDESRTSAHQPCSLPDQLRIYCWVYATLAFATIVLVAARAALAPPPRRQKHAAKSSVELPTYRASLQRPPHAPSRKRSYPLRVVGGLLTIAWLPLAIYVIIAVAVFW